MQKLSTLSFCPWPGNTAGHLDLCIWHWGELVPAVGKWTGRQAPDNVSMLTRDQLQAKAECCYSEF